MRIVSGKVPIPARWLAHYVQSLLLFLPLLVFITYALWYGPPPEARWLQAYKIASPLALAQLAWASRSCEPVSRLLLGANFYLLIGGFCAWFAFAPGLDVLATLKGAGVLLAILIVGALSTWKSRAGFVGATNGDPKQILRNSIWLLLATVLALVTAYAFRAAPRYGTAIPLVALVFIARTLRLDAEGQGARTREAGQKKW